MRSAMGVELGGLADGSIRAAHSAARPRLRGRAPRAGPHACWRAFSPLSTSFARSRYSAAASPSGS